MLPKSLPRRVHEEVEREVGRREEGRVSGGTGREVGGVYRELWRGKRPWWRGGVSC